MKKYAYLLFVIMPLTSIAQEKISFLNQNEKIEFQISNEEFFIKFDSKKDKQIEENKSINYTKISNDFGIVKISEQKDNLFSKKSITVKKLTNLENIEVEPVLIYSDGVKQICNGEIIIKTSGDLNKIFNDLTFTFIENELFKNQYLVKFEKLNTFDLFDLVKNLQKNNEIEFIEPNFTRLLKPYTNDPFFSQQWAINNNGLLWSSDADMDVDDAWIHSTGSGVKVAIIDEGVDLTHPDLINNLLPGFDATGNNSNGAPNANINDAHGTACAGIVAAVANNNIGISGIAYNAKIIPVRIGYSNGLPLTDQNRTWVTNDNWMANGITWAVQNGADILSNSWGGGSPSTAITDAINYAVNSGRSGKGCTVFFATGNFNTDVAFPSTLPNVIAVGASSPCDQRKTPSSCDGETWWGSNFGSTLDIVAPGVKIYATDITGSNGYDGGDYKRNFNGTSSACPNAAGVTALILSMYPDMYQEEVRNILERSTDKIGNYLYSPANPAHTNGPWNEEVGYGRINALKAIQYAIQYNQGTNREIVGLTQLTPGLQATYFINEPYGTATNYVWTIPYGCSNNYCWELTGGQGTSQINVSAGRTGVQNISCKVYNGNTLLAEHDLNINVQNPYIGGSGTDTCGSLVYGAFVIYPPVPCDDFGSLSVGNIYPIYFKNVYIYNMYGQLVYFSQEKEQVNISHLRDGVYIVKAELNTGEMQTKKIIKN
jgi:subtilisin family serine protease